MIFEMGREQVFAVSKDVELSNNEFSISNLWDWVETDWDTALNIVADNLDENLQTRWLGCDGGLCLCQSHQRR